MEFDYNHIKTENLLSSRKQNVIIHNCNSDISERYEFQNPYLIAIEDCSESNGTFQITRLSPGSIHNVSLKYMKDTNRRPQHQHNYLEVMCVLSGTLIHHVEKQRVVYHPGQCCIMNRNIKHCEEFTGDFKAVFFNFRDDYLNDLIENDIYFTSDESMRRYDGKIYTMVNDGNMPQSSYHKVYLNFTPMVSAEIIMDQMNVMIDKMVSESIQKKSGYYFILKGLFARFFSLLEDTSMYCCTKVQADSTGQEYLFNKTAHFMEVYNGRISRTELEALMNYNGEYLNRIVKKYTGMNLVRYGQSIYLTKAKDLLLNSEKSISEIVQELGFMNRTHFNEIFKRKFGTTPREFRKLNTRVLNS